MITASRILWLYLLTVIGITLSILTIYGLAKLPLLSNLGVTGTYYAMDFLNFWAAPQIAWQDISQLFSLDAYNHALAQLGMHSGYRHVWSYPPHALALLTPFTIFSLRNAYVLWSLAGLAVYSFIVTRRITHHRVLAVIFALASPVTIANIHKGQNGLFTAALLLGAILLIEARPKLAGLFLGLLSIKPQLLLAWPVVLFRERKWNVIIAAALTLLLLIALSIALYGIDVWRGFFTFTVPLQAELANVPPEERGYQIFMPTLPMALQLFGASHPLAFICQWVMDAIIAITLWRTVSLPTDTARRAILITTAGMLMSPYALEYDMAAMSAAIFWFFFNEPRPRKIELALYSLGYLLPALICYLYFYLPIAPFILIAIFGVTTWRMHRELDSA